MGKRAIVGVLLVLTLGAATAASLRLTSGNPLSQDKGGLPPAKQAYEDQYEAERNAALTAGPPTPDNPNHLPLPTGTPKPPPEGIVERPNPLPGYFFENMWSQLVGDTRVAVYAGRLTGNQDTGVIVRLTSKSPTDPPVQVVREVPGLGSLRVEAVHKSTTGFALAIRSIKGSCVSFDLVSTAVASASADFCAQPSEAPAAGFSYCCALQLDMDASTPGVQSTVTVPGPQDIDIGIVLGDDAGELNAFNFKVVYDDTRLTPVATTGAGTTNGNPGLNEAALGAGWTCSLPSGSATPDIDPATGPDHGVAFLSCSTTGTPATLTGAVTVATLRVHVAASGTSALSLAEAAFFHPLQSEIGSCAPVITVEMPCFDGTVTAP